MKSETRTYRIKVLSPLHIGCGQVYEPTSFVIKEQEKVLVGFDPWAFLMSLSSGKREQYSAICKKGTVDSLLEIYDFINREAQSMVGVEAVLSSEFIKHYKDTLKNKNFNKFHIERTAFNSLDNSLYIPGSAIKGSLRTAVLEHRFKKRPFIPPGNPKKVNIALQGNLLGGIFQKDSFSRLKISDFYQVEQVERRIVYGINKEKKPVVVTATPATPIFEVIAPGAVFEGTITIVKETSGMVKKVSFQEIETALVDFFGGECQRETGQAKAIGVSYSIQKNKGQIPIRLGRHCGAECVTSVDKERKIKILMGPGLPPQTLDHATTIWFASSSKSPKSNNALQPFGWASLYQPTAEEIAAGEEFRRKLKEQQDRLWEEQRQRLEEERQQRKAVLEQQRQAEEERKLYEERIAKEPWRPWVEELGKIDNWGDLKEKIECFPESIELASHPDADSLLQSSEKEQWRRSREVGEAIVIAAKKVKKEYPKKWDKERDNQVIEWLEETGVNWELPIAEPAEKIVESETVATIRAFANLGEFQQSSFEIKELDLEAAVVLQQRLKEWGCDQKKVKKNKQKIWKEVDAHIKKLEKK